MAEYKFSCPQCGQHVQCTDDFFGKQVNCPNCQKAIIVTRPKGAAPVVANQAAPVERISRSSVLRIAVIAAIAFGLCAGLVIGGLNYFFQQRAQKKELQLAQMGKEKVQKNADPNKPKARSESQPTTNAVTDTMLMLVSGSTLQAQLDLSNASLPANLSVQSSNLDTLNLDVKSLTKVNDHTLSLTKTLMCSGNVTVKVTGSSTDTLALGDIIGRTALQNSAYGLTINTPFAGPSVTIGSFCSGEWGQWLVLRGGGKIIITGNLTNAAAGNPTLYINDGTMVTMMGASTPHASHAYKYCVAYGTLILNNNNALVNNTTDKTGTDKLLQSCFILGAATDAFSGRSIKRHVFSPPSKILVRENNDDDAAVYLGDASHADGGLKVNATVTNYISDGDDGFVNGGVFTIGGQNTSGVNVYANPIILGWTTNMGKSVTLVAATGGEVDFTGGLLANGTDKSAGVTVGDAAHGGVIKFTAANTYGGGTFINNGTLALGGTGSIANSVNIVMAGGTTFDVSGLESAFTLGSGQTLSNSKSTADLDGNVNTGSGAVSLTYASGIPSLTISKGTLEIAGDTVFKVNNAGSALVPGSYKIISKQSGGTVKAANTLPVVNVSGNGIAVSTKAALQVNEGELYLIIAPP